MQMKGLKYISVLLLVNIAILIGHNLVPHHHHLSSATFPISNECSDKQEFPGTSHDHQDEDSFPNHCHTFNNLAFVKYSQSQVPVPERLASLMMAASQGISLGV